MSNPIQADASAIGLIHGLRRRTWFAQMGLSCVWMFGGCKDDTPDMPSPPYGQALDVTQADTVVEFDIRIDKPERYDLVLEIFKRHPKDEIIEFAAIKDAHFSMQIQSLSGTGGLVLEREVKHEGKPYNLYRKAVAVSLTEKNKQMSESWRLITEYPLSEGFYRIHCVNRIPLPMLRDRLVKVTIEHRNFPK